MKAFRSASEVEPSELPGKLKTLREYVFDSVEYDCRNLAEKIHEWRDKGLYLHFAPTWEGFIRENFKQSPEWVDHMLAAVAILDGATLAKPLSYRESLANAIADIERRVSLLQSQGVRSGHVLPNPTSAGTIQYHWINAGKKKYIKLAAVPAYRAECHRGKRVAELQEKARILQNL